MRKARAATTNKDVSCVSIPKLSDRNSRLRLDRSLRNKAMSMAWAGHATSTCTDSLAANMWERRGKRPMLSGSSTTPKSKFLPNKGGVYETMHDSAMTRNEFPTRTVSVGWSTVRWKLATPSTNCQTSPLGRCCTRECQCIMSKQANPNHVH